MSAKIQRPRRITSESVPNDSKQAVDTVGSSFNTFADEAYTAIMGNLGVVSNLNMEYKTITITVDSDGIPDSNVAFKSAIRGKIRGMQVIRAFLAIPTAQPFITFVENAGLVTISHVSGLTADTKYQLVILSSGE